MIIVAHSQGTVIAAETLRYLHLIGGSPLAKSTKLRLFTMGSPLRQIYARRFPHLYSWIVPSAPTAHVAESSERKTPQPDPAELGLTTWWNAYRSGDYIGRGMWWSDFEQGADVCVPTEHFEPSLEPPDAQLPVCDICIGAGGHTHYWDETAALIGKTLDSLIGAADGDSDRHRGR